MRLPLPAVPGRSIFKHRLHRRSVAFAAFGLAVFTAFPASAQAEADHFLIGSWEVVAAEENGAKDDAPEEEALIFGPDKLEIKLRKAHDGQQPPFQPEIFYRLDGQASPAAIDLTLKLDRKDASKEVNILGIVKKSGDQVTLCLAPPGRDRPNTFETKKGDNRRLLTLKPRKTSE